MKLKLNRKTLLFAVAAVLLLSGGFATGFISSLHLRSSPSNEARKLYLQDAGDAPPAVRAGVLTALRAFQDGYIKRDPKGLDSFMSRLFAKNDDLLILGTDVGEWVRGYPAAAEFIRTDWQRWGDLRLAADDPIICSSGDVAWMTSYGDVHFNGGQRPVRFSAILTRQGNDWLFQEVHFQWDDRGPGAADLLRPKTYLQLARLVFRRITNPLG